MRTRMTEDVSASTRNPAMLHPLDVRTNPPSSRLDSSIAPGSSTSPTSMAENSSRESQIVGRASVPVSLVNRLGREPRRPVSNAALDESGLRIDADPSTHRPMRGNGRVIQFLGVKQRLHNQRSGSRKYTSRYPGDTLQNDVVQQPRLRRAQTAEATRVRQLGCESVGKGPARGAVKGDDRLGLSFAVPEHHPVLGLHGRRRAIRHPKLDRHAVQDCAERRVDLDDHHVEPQASGERSDRVPNRDHRRLAQGAPAERPRFERNGLRVTPNALTHHLGTAFTLDLARSHDPSSSRNPDTRFTCTTLIP